MTDEKLRSEQPPFGSLKDGADWIAQQLPNIPQIGAWLKREAERVAQLQAELTDCKAAAERAALTHANGLTKISNVL